MSDNRPVPVVHRQTLHMVATNAEEIAHAIGLPPISEEVADQERKDAQKRLERIAKLQFAVEDQAGLLAAVYVRIQRDQAEVNGMPVQEVDWQHVHDVMFHWLNTNGMALIALLVDIGVLHLDAEWDSPSEQTQE